MVFRAHPDGCNKGLVLTNHAAKAHHFTRRQAKTTSAREVFACRRVLWGVGEFWACVYIWGLFPLYFTSFRMLFSIFFFSLLIIFVFVYAALACDSLRPSREGLQTAAFAEYPGRA